MYAALPISLRKATELVPDFPDAHDLLAAAFFRIGDREGAMEQFQILNRLDPAFDGAIKKLLSEEESKRK